MVDLIAIRNCNQANLTRKRIVIIPTRKEIVNSFEFPAEKNNRKCNGFNGNCIGFNGNYNGVHWYVMDYIGGMLKPFGKMPKTHYTKEFCNALLEKANGL